MWQLVREVLSTPVGSFAFILSFMILAGWLIHYITRFITKWTCNMEGSKSTVDKVESNIDSIRSDISYIKGMINILQANANPLTQSHSPIGLSEKGKKVAEEMGVASMIADNWEHISTYIQDNTKSKNAYDIQQFCIETASSYKVKDDRLAKPFFLCCINVLLCKPTSQPPMLRSASSGTRSLDGNCLKPSSETSG